MFSKWMSICLNKFGHEQESNQNLRIQEISPCYLKYVISFEKNLNIFEN